MEVKIEPGWKELLADQFASDYFIKLATFVKSEYNSKTVYPPGRYIFNALNLCPPESVKAVIIGQDPYHNPGQAHGLCFSVPDTTAHPPSLLNIFKEIRSDTGLEPHRSGNLERWASQGVLLLNAILTVRENEAGSHQNKGWEKFTDSVIKVISDRKSNVVFLLWGRYAQDKGATIDQSRHLVLTSVHPSPLSASRGFFGNKHFTRCNEYLVDNGIAPIDWR
jgi:uracil-DNA glycosylase